MDERSPESVTAVANQLEQSNQREQPPDSDWIVPFLRQAWSQALHLYWTVYEQQPQETLLGTAAVLLFLLFLGKSGLLSLLLTLAIGATAGYLYATPELTARGTAFFASASSQKLLQKWRLLHSSATSPTSTATPGFTGATAAAAAASSDAKPPPPPIPVHELHVSPAVDPSLNRLLDLFVRDFITWWYEPLCEPGSDQFQQHVRHSLNAVVMNFLEYARYAMSGSRNLEISSLITYGFANTLIVHFREYRQFEAAGTSLETYLQKTSDDANILFSERNLALPAVRKRAHDISCLLVNRLLPVSDMRCKPMLSLVQEIFTAYVIWPVVEMLSDPSTLHVFLLSCLEASMEKEDIDQSEESGEGKSPFAADVRSFAEEWEERGIFILVLHQLCLPAPFSLGLDSTKKHEKSVVLDPATLSVNMILQRNDTFSAFMEYLESVQAPPYLRFWTNADIYKQFALLSLNENKNKKALVETMRTDAMYVFDAHFSPDAELPLCLSMEEEHGTDSQVGALSHDKEGQTIVDALYEEIQRKPNPNCFHRCQQYVLKILQQRYLDGFKTSGIFRQYILQAGLGSRVISPISMQPLPSMAPTDVTSVSAKPFETAEPVQSNADKLTESKKSPFSDTEESDADVDLGNQSAFALDDDVPAQVQSFLEEVREASNENDISLQPGMIALQPPSEQVQSPPDDPMVHLAAEITQFRQQLLHLDTAIDAIRPHSAMESLNMENNARIRKLEKSKREVEKQIGQLMKMATDLQSQERLSDVGSSSQGSVMNSPAVGRRYSFETGVIDLEHVQLVVTAPASPPPRVPSLSASEESLPKQNSSSGILGIRLNTISNLGSRITSGLVAGGNVLTSLASNGALPGNSLTAEIKTMAFQVTLTQTNSHLPRTWVLPRTLVQFAHLHHALRNQFTKVDKIQFPVLRRPPSKEAMTAVGGMTTPEIREWRLKHFCQDLQGYLQILIGDALLRDSPAVQRFFLPNDSGGSVGGSVSGSRISLAFSGSRRSSISDLKEVTLMEEKMGGRRFSQTTSRASLESVRADPMELSSATSTKSQLLSKPTLDTDSLGVSKSPERTSAGRTPSPKKSASAAIVAEPPKTPLDASKLSDADLPLIIDSAFALLTDLFDLHNSRHWLRRRAIAVLRQLLLQATQDKAGRVYNILIDGVRWWVDALRYASKEERLVKMLDGFRDSYWPDGVWFSDPSHAQKSAQEELTAQKNKNKGGEVDATMEQEAATTTAKEQQQQKKRAREALIQLITNPSTSASSGGANPIDRSSTVQFYLHRIVGRQNAVQAMNRLFDMVQERPLNRVLVLGLLEVIVKLVFSEDRRKFG